jgi:hypothetical protein
MDRIDRRDGLLADIPGRLGQPVKLRKANLDLLPTFHGISSLNPGIETTEDGGNLREAVID